MNYEVQTLARLENDIKQAIQSSYSNKQPVFQHADGRRLYLDEALSQGLEEGPLIGALVVIIATGRFVAVDRVVRGNSKFKKQRRIILYLDSKPGQIASTLLLELLKLEDGAEFSKSKFVRYIDETYFQSQKINISSGEINEALSRIFRKTMSSFFNIKGKNLMRGNFTLVMQELKVNKHTSVVNYENYKHEIDNLTYNTIKKLNKFAIA